MRKMTCRCRFDLSRSLVVVAVALAASAACARQPVPERTPVDAATKSESSPFARETILAEMRRVADHQLAANTATSKKDANWIRANLYVGILALADASGDAKYQDAAVTWASEEGDWKISGAPSTQPAKGRRHADNQAIGWTYAELSKRLDDPSKRADVETLYNEITGSEVAGRVDWWWCDALNMAPPTLARIAKVTNDARYLHLMDRLFWDTVDFLYDKDDRLFYRDKGYFDKRVDGQKIFWSRGNGWVVSGLARVIRDLPKDHPTRGRYIELFRAMCDRLASLQGEDGLWRSNLLVPGQFPNPETSGTAFFAFGMTAGINDGLLDRKKFEPIVRRAWLGLNKCVLDDGRLGYVQNVAGSPGPAEATSTREYAVGAFLLAGKEMIDLGEPKVDATFEPMLEPAASKPAKEEESKTALVAPKPGAKAHCMLVPTRMDDFAWENDRVAFRAYGPALLKKDGPQSGIDIWMKRTPKLVQGQFYAKEDYHADHGDGLDGYHVGTTRGCGGTAIVRDEKLFIGANYTSYKILEDGPDRCVFVLDYAPENCDGLTVTEQKKFTLEAGSQFNKIESTWTFDGPPIEVAVGLKIHPKANLLTHAGDDTRFLASWEPVDGKDNGNTGVAVILQGDKPLRVMEKDDQLLAVTTVKSGETLTYHAGGGWSKYGFADSDAWLAHVREVASKVSKP